jgi:hypothetical protein
MAYDAATGQMVLFGGFDLIGGNANGLNDTWTWDGTTWTQQNPSTSPSARNSASMAYDAATGQMVLFGGLSGTDLNDTWTWDGTTWTQLSPATSPPARYGASMVYDAASGQMVLFGGASPDTGTLLGDTWTWDGTTWTQLSPATSPHARYNASMVYDAATGQITLFGGQDSTNFDNETWTWDGATWTQLSPAASPPPTGNASMAYDATSGDVVLFGGQVNTGYELSSDTWSWDGTNWTQLAPGTSPSLRQFASMDYDAATGNLVLFGGQYVDFLSGTSTWFNDTWVLEQGADSVSFSSDGGAAVASLSGIDGSSITLPSDTYAGFAFDGWFTAPSGGTFVGAAGASYVIPAGGATLYAQWTENNIDTVAFNSDGGAAVPSVSGPDGSSITLPTDTQSIDIFNGWFTAPSGGTEVGAAGASYVIPAGGATLYAQWTLVDTVSFSPDGGVSTVGSITGPDGTLITLPTATRASYIFDGWFTAKKGGTEVGAAGASYAIPVGGATLYAQWTRVHKL